MQLVSWSCANVDVKNGEATVSKEIERIDLRTAAAWKKSLTVEAYLQRERVLKAQPFSRGMTVHALVDSEDRGRPGQPGPMDAARGAILASCETYRVPVRIPGHRGPTHGCGIASVFVDAQQRGKGFATVLLREVIAHCQAEGASLLYLISEIGEPLYRPLGFEPWPWSVCRLPATPRRATSSCQFLTQNDFDQTSLEKTLSAARTVLLPSVEQVYWHLSRSLFYAQALHKTPLQTIGAKAQNAVALWAQDRDADGDLLRVLLIEPTTDEPTVQTLLDAACACAFSAGLPRIDVWESQGAPFLPRDLPRFATDDLPMVLWLDPNLRTQDLGTVHRCLWL